MNPQPSANALGLPALDWIAIGLLLVFAILGVFRGGPWQLRRFLGVILAMLVASLLSPIAGPTVSSLIDPTQPRLGLGIGYLLLFLLTLCVLALLFKLLTPRRAKNSKKNRHREDEEESSPAPKHRGMGLAFGLLTGLALYSTLIASILLLDPSGGSRPSFTNSRSARWTAHVIFSMGETFPLAARQQATTPR